MKLTDSEIEQMRRFVASNAYRALIEGCAQRFTTDFRLARDLDARIKAAGLLDALDELTRQISATIDDIEIDSA